MAATVDYPLLSDSYAMSKTGYLKLRELPVFKGALPYVESTTAYALTKAGLPAEMETLEASYITPTLTKLDEKYVSPAAVVVKEKYTKTTDGLGSRPLPEYKEKVVSAVECAKTKAEAYKATALGKAEAYKATALGYYDDAKDVVASSKAKVQGFFAKDDATEVTA